MHFGKFVFKLLAFETGELRQAHFENGRRLEYGETKLLLERGARRWDVGRFLDDCDDFVDVVERFTETEEDVLTRLGLTQIVLGAALHDFLTMRNEMMQDALQGEHLRYTVNEREHVVVESALKLRVLIERIQHRLRMRRALQLHDNADVACRLIAQIADAFDLFFLH